MTVRFEQETGIERGPFRSFHHEHVFEALEGATRMIDRIRFDTPLGPIGRLVEGAQLRSYMGKLIAVRSGYLKAEAERRSRGYLLFSSSASITIMPLGPRT